MAKMYKKDFNYWRNYYSDDIVHRAEALRREHTIESTGVQIHIDVYEQPDPQSSPTVIFNHGSLVYSRMFTHLALDIHALNYNVVMADQRGQGLSGGKRGDYTVPECVQNIVDVCYWAKDRYPSSLFISGGSIGGAYSYYAAASGIPVNAIAAVNLFNFGIHRDALDLSRYAWQTKIPGAGTWNALMFKVLGRLFGNVKIPILLVGKFEKVMAKGQKAYDLMWSRDPNVERSVSLRYTASNFDNPPAIPFEQNRIPILVMNQSNDRMIPPEMTKRNYDALSGDKKYVVLEGFEHWSNKPEFWETVVTETHNWFQKYI